mgnify:CR=1 FL=1
MSKKNNIYLSIENKERGHVSNPLIVSKAIDNFLEIEKI